MCGVFVACVTDIRINNRWLPMMIEENQLSKAAEVDLISKVKMGCIRDDCAQVLCPQGQSLGQSIKQICVPVWGDHECRQDSLLISLTKFYIQGCTECVYLGTFNM